MPQLTTEQMRAMLDKIDEDAEKADSQARVEQLEARLQKIEETIPNLGLSDKQRQLLEDAVATVEADLEDAEAGIDDVKSDNSARNGGDSKGKKRTRPGRKHGQVYQDEPGGVGYVYEGEDEPDEVELDDDEEEE